MKYGLTVVIGKFLPPHRGHKLLIDIATDASVSTVVIVCGKPTDPIPPEARGAWLRELHPRVEVMVIDDRYDENDSQVWAENTKRWLGRAPDAVFTSEDYGERYAELMGAKHISVDRARAQVPVSGTAVRADPFHYWQYIEPPVRGWFAKRVCILGAESTGTTTLARDLAAALNTVWVAEYGREYSARKQAAGNVTWGEEEFVHIAGEQTRQENAAAREANRVLICDTNAFATILWQRRYLGSSTADVEAIGRAARCDLYLLTGDEIPFVQDGLRDGEPLRHEMHRWFTEALEQQSIPWRLLRGSPGQRLQNAFEAVTKLFTVSAWNPAVS